MASGFATTGTVNFSRGSTEFDLDLNRQSPITTEQLGHMFHVRQDTIWLASQFDNRAYFPQDGAFDLRAERFPTLTTLTVQGQPAEADNHTSTRSQQQTVTLSSTPARSQWSGWTSVAGSSQNTIRSKPTASSGYPLKTVQARILRFDGGKPQFERVGQVFVNITDYPELGEIIVKV